LSNKVLTFGADARHKMLVGIEKLERAVVATLGPKGRCVAFYRGTSHPVYTKDGVSVSREIWLKDHLENCGACTLKEAGEKTNSEAGDGTTTTQFLGAELCKSGVSLVDSGKEPVEIQKGFDAACEDVLAALDKYKKVITSDKDILSVATISANNDPVVGNNVLKAFTSIGEGGVVNVLDSHNKSGKTIISISDGMEWPTGLVAGRMINNKKSESYEVKNPKIAVFDFEPSLDDAAELLNYCLGKSLPCVLIAESFDEDLENMCTRMDIERKANFALIKAPGVNSIDMSERLKDIAVISGTEVIKDREALKDFNCEKDFGTCGSIKSTMFKTTIEDGAGDDDSIDARVAEIKADIEKGLADEDVGLSTEEVNVMNKRIAALTGGIATISVGGLTETRVKELYDRYVDAVCAVNAAISDGIVPGGGAALLKAARDVRNNKKEFPNDSYRAGYEALLDVCRMPATQIIQSVTKDYAYIVSSIEHDTKDESGYDAKNEKMEADMFAAGVIDPLKVEKTALKYATSVAGILITTECVVSPEAQNIDLVPKDEVSARTDENYGGGF
jgi:chaperonin GroEL